MLTRTQYIIGICLLALTGLSSAIWYATRPPSVRPNPIGDKSLQQFYEQAQSLTKTRGTAQTNTTVTFLAVGDISLSRSVAQTIKTKQDPLYPFRKIEALLTTTDFNFGNLETPFSSNDAFNPNKTMVFNAPKPNVAGLVNYNFAVLNLANNHAFDQGLDGITTTAQVLDTHGLLHMGTGRTLEEAWAPAILEKNGIKIGFIGASYASINDGGKTTNTYVARIEDTDRLKSQISSLKPQVDFIVVTMHAGTEYTLQPNQSQINFAHAAIDAGADIVIGAHPHWVQEKELYCPTSGTSPFKQEITWNAHSQPVDTNSLYPDCKWIYYSLGNFIFDQSWSEATKQGLTLKITLSKNGIASASQSPPQGATITDLQPTGGVINQPRTSLQSIEEIPIYIRENCCPEAMTK